MRIGLVEVGAGPFARRSGQPEGAEDHLRFDITSERPGLFGQFRILFRGKDLRRSNVVGEKGSFAEAHCPVELAPDLGHRR